MVWSEHVRTFFDSTQSQESKSEVCTLLLLLQLPSPLSLPTPPWPCHNCTSTGSLFQLIWVMGESYCILYGLSDINKRRFNVCPEGVAVKTGYRNDASNHYCPSNILKYLFRIISYWRIKFSKPLLDHRGESVARLFCMFDVLLHSISKHLYCILSQHNSI